jgi:L-2-hydroxycarboxylate dehydrogenase (NAD+)
MPGERSHETRMKRTSAGIPVAPALLRALDQVADDLGISRLGG